jgi:hypothetical protein
VFRILRRRSRPLSGDDNVLEERLERSSGDCAKLPAAERKMEDGTETLGAETAAVVVRYKALRLVEIRVAADVTRRGDLLVPGF